jgi:hypothetical protein
MASPIGIPNLPVVPSLRVVSATAAKVNKPIANPASSVFIVLIVLILSLSICLKNEA